MTDFSFDKLLICDPDKSRSTCHIYIAHQSPAEEKSLGKFFIITEIASHNKVNIDIINNIQEELRLNYYNTDDLNIETAFEKALERVNQRIADMVGDYDINWLDHFSMIAAVIKGDVLHIAYVGTIHAFLIRRDKITNIIDSATDGEPLYEKINPLKAFSQIITGNFLPGDALLCCTPSLLDYLSQEKLKKTIDGRSASQAIASLDAILSENTTNTAFGALIIKAEAVPLQYASGGRISAPMPVRPATNQMPYTSPQSSMEGLIQKQVDTDKILTPSLSGYIWNRLRNTFTSFSHFIKIKVLRQSPRRVQFTGARNYMPAAAQKTEEKRTAPVLVGSLAQGAHATGRAFTAGVGRLTALFAKKQESVQATAQPTTLYQRLEQRIIKIKRLPTISKILLVCAVAVAFFLAQDIFNSASSRDKNQTSTSYDQTIATISQDITSAEADLSYGNEEGAKKLLTTAQGLLNSLPNKTKNEKSKFQELQAGINAQLGKTKHVVTIDSPKELANLSKDDATIAARDLVLTNKALYTFDPAKKTVYAVATNDGKLQSWPQSVDTSFQYLIPQTNTTLLFLTAANKLDEFNASSGKINLLSFAFSSSDVNIVSVTYYVSRSSLYFLDIKNNQIYRSSKGSGGFSSPVAWIKDGTGVTDAVSLTVDGDVYVLKKSGEVIKLTLGSRASWSLTSIEPALTKADRIWTDTTTNNVYVLDIKGRRIVELTKKDGKLLNQYTFPSLTAIKSFAVDVSGKKLFVLNNNTIFSTDLNP